LVYFTSIQVVRYEEIPYMGGGESPLSSLRAKKNPPWKEDFSVLPKGA